MNIMRVFLSDHRKRQPILLLIFAIAINCFVANLFFAQSVHAAWTDIGTQLPDDLYHLRLPNGTEATTVNGADGIYGTADDCYQVDTAQHGQCTTFGYGTGNSHQYITLTYGSINDDNHPYPGGYPDASTVSFEVFTSTANLNNKNITIDIVDRGIGLARACQGYNVSYIYKKPSGPQVGGGSKPISGCQPYQLNFFPISGFEEIKDINGVGTGVFKGEVTLRLPLGTPASKQASLHIGSTSGGMRFGYAPGWVNTYPTNLADGHRVIYRFSPPCETPVGTPFIIAWDDVNQGSVFQPPVATFRVFREHRDGSAKTQIGPTHTPGNGYDELAFTTSNYAADTPFVYSVEFENVYGGNGISFNHPFSSANFHLACSTGGCVGPCGSSWHLSPTIAPGPGAGAYTPAFGDANYTNDVNNAFAAFGQARFSLGVNELAGVGVAAGSHNWDVQYKYVRGDTGTESAIFTKDKNYTGAVSAGGSLTFTNSSQVPTGSASGMRWLVGDRYYDGGPLPATPHRTPRANDAYCERLVIDGFTAGNVVDSPGGWACVTLNEACVSATWHVESSSAIYQVDGANNPVTGSFGNSFNDAWVGARYGYYYSFSHSGLAAATGPINFYHNSGPPPTYTQALGNWDPAYFVGIDASMGGQTLVDSMGYEPTDGFSDCSVFGNNTLTNSIVVPYYFHLKPSSTITNIPADRIFQGDPINTTINVNLPVQDDQGDLSGEAASDNEFGGRQHTWSSPTNWRIIEFKASDINNAKAVVPKNRSGGSGDCPELSSFGIAGFAGCGIVSAGNQVFTIGDASLAYTRPAQLDPVGTNICYVGVVGSPTHTGSPAWRYSDVSCTTVVKSPKVQFLNGDLTVGRHRLTDGPPPCTPPVAGASIQATGAPSLAPAPVNIYGSWVEYGAFATGTINGFGTAAFADDGTSSSTKLMFGNTPTRGNYSYAAGCLSNPFDLIKEPDVNYIDAQASDLRLNQLFTTPPYNTAAADKTGYVANNASGTNPKNVLINQSPAPASPLDDSFAGFRARDIIIYAKKGAGTCGPASVGGNITVNTDINYAKTGYGDINELPRIILLADCKIIINDNVKRVDAWLIAKDAVETCSDGLDGAPQTGQKFAAPTAIEPNQNTCPDQLIINGPVQANRLLLWRTHGSDLTDPVTSKEAAEIYNLRPDQLLSTYARGRDAGKPHTVYQTDLPPLY